MTSSGMIGDTIRAALEEKGISKQQLTAILAAETGMSTDSVRRQVNRWTSKKNPQPTISQEWAYRIGRALDQPPGWLPSEHVQQPATPIESSPAFQRAVQEALVTVLVRDQFPRLEALAAAIDQLSQAVERLEQRLADQDGPQEQLPGS